VDGQQITSLGEQAQVQEAGAGVDVGRSAALGEQEAGTFEWMGSRSHHLESRKQVLEWMWADQHLESRKQVHWSG
jgi:hypothetical protein